MRESVRASTGLPLGLCIEIVDMQTTLSDPVITH